MSNNGKEEFEICTTGCVAGKSGSGNGQFNGPLGVTVDSAGNVWVVDEHNARVEKFNEKGEYLSKFGSLGSGNGQMHEPGGIAISDGNLYVAEYSNSRVQEFSPTGAYISQFGGKGTGNGQFEGADGIAVDPVSGDLYVADFGNARVEELTPSGVFLTSFGSKGSGNEQFKGPEGVAVNQAGLVYVADTENNRVQTWEPIPSAPVYGSQLGSAGNGNGQFNGPRSVAVDSSGDIWAVDSKNNRVEELSAAGVYMKQFGSEGTGVNQFKTPWFIAINRSTGNMYVSDYVNNRVEEFSSTGAFVRMFGFGVGKGEEKFETCTASCRAGTAGAGNGQFSGPLGITIDSSGNVWVVDEKNARVEEFSETGAYLGKFGAIGSGNGQLHEPGGITISGGNLYMADNFNDRVEEFSTAGAYISQFGVKGTGSGQFQNPEGIATDPATGNLYVTDSGNSRVQELSPSGVFLTTFGTKGAGNGQLKEPEGLAIGATGAVYVADFENNRVQEWIPRPRPGNEAAKDSKTIEYSAAANTENPSCGEHPEWAGLTCITEPAAQPGVSGLPELPVTTITYNMWDEPETTAEKFGSITRTRKVSYDGAGREKSSEETSSADTPIPTVTDEYSPASGALVEQSSTVEGKLKTIKSVYNRLGQLESYTDADGGTTKYAYEASGDVRLNEMSYEVGKEKFSQLYTYSAVTGLMTELYDSAVKKAFTATYDVEGKMLTEGYPNGMTAYYAYNPLGQAINLEYKKETHCTEKCILFSDALTYSIEDNIASQVSTLSKESYVHDAVGNLTETQEIPAGKGCVSRIYGYNEESERTSLTTRESSTEACATEGGTVEAHSYDVVGRLLDAGVMYDAFGNMTKVPSVDAGGTELKSTFYVDSQVASQEQNGQEISYKYDPEGRARETINKGKVNSTVTSHYSGPGNTPTWTTEEEEKKWSRNVRVLTACSMQSSPMVEPRYCSCMTCKATLSGRWY